MSCPICTSPHTYYFAKKDTYVYYRCKICKTVFLHPFPSKQYLNAYYSRQASYTNGLKNEPLIRERSHKILKKLRQIAPYAKTVCDVGSSYGFFLDEAQKKGYMPTGIEPSRQIANHAKRNYHIPTFIGELKDYKVPKQFDIVTCIHVIEHVSNPKEFISHLLKLVAPGGILYIETPNSDSHLLYIEKEQYTFLLPPEHLWLFSKEAIIKLLPKDIKPIYISTYSYSEHFMGIVKRVIKELCHSECNEESRPPDRKHALSSVSEDSARSFGKSPQDDKVGIKKRLSYFFFDRLLAPLFTGLLNINHKGSILELYIKKK